MPATQVEGVGTGALPLQNGVFAKQNLTPPNWIEEGQKIS